MKNARLFTFFFSNNATFFVESRKEWMVWIACPDSSGLKQGERKNGNNNDLVAFGWQFLQQNSKPTEM